jgi:outer membrane immunogenic protein
MRSKLLGIFATTALMFAGAQAASAADLPMRPAYKAPFVAPAWSWTGFYVGVHAGYGGDQFSYPFNVVGVPGEAQLNSSGGLAGGQIGYNWQTGNFVLGAEADAAWSDITGRVSANAAGLALSAGSKLEWFGTVRGRAGYAVDRFMVYATGGLAYGDTRTTASVTAPVLGTAAFAQTNRKVGWTVGGGFEYALWNNVSIKTEYLYLDLGTDAVFTSPAFSISEHTTAHTLKAGVNWRFM